jgi:hypothetical protein
MRRVSIKRPMVEIRRYGRLPAVYPGQPGKTDRVPESYSYLLGTAGVMRFPE